LEELSGIKAKEVVGAGQQWRAFYKTARPCMADLLVDKYHKKFLNGILANISNQN